MIFIYYLIIIKKNVQLIFIVIVNIYLETIIIIIGTILNSFCIIIFTYILLYKNIGGQIFKYFFVNFNSYIDYFGGLNELNLYEVELNKRCTTVAKIADLAQQEISFKAFLETEAFYESFSQKQQLESAVPSIQKSRKPKPTFKV